jgi:DNA-binding transcriptional regulator YiaG
MTAAEFRALRKSLGLTQPQAARALGVGVRSVKTYELGEGDPPQPVARLLRAFARVPALMSVVASAGTEC